MKNSLANYEYLSIQELCKFLLLLFVLQQNIHLSTQITSCDIKQYNGTTSNLDQIMIGRCQDFLNVVHKDDCSFNRAKYDCNKIWNSFKSATVNKNPCEIRVGDYDEFLAQADHTIPENTTLFWSGTYNAAHESMQKETS